jgi:hypothetical protein
MRDLEDGGRDLASEERAAEAKAIQDDALALVIWMDKHLSRKPKC